MTYLLPPLNALRAFEAAARHLSFRLAAQELHVTPGAVSQQVKLLEERLGIRLFERLHRRLLLTDAGRSYLVPLRQAFTQIADATTDLKPDKATTTVNVGLHATFEFARIRDRLAAFRAKQPRIAVRITQPASLRELVEGKLDVVIDRGINRFDGYRCDSLRDATVPAELGYYLICPVGTADCSEMALFRECVLGRASVIALPPLGVHSATVKRARRT
jgi:LysR family glycine cleavage system transcriptional activator